MGIGREVADAYIDVHGDLSKFRRDLAGAEGDVEKAARENADAFSDAWGKRIEKDINGKWDSILDAMYSEKQVDWDKMVGEFDPRSFDDARKKITEFLREMRETHGFAEDDEGGLIDLGPKLDSKKFDEMVGRLHEVLGAMQKQEDQQRRLVDLQQELTEWQEREARAQGVRAEAEEEAHRENERWMERRAKKMQEAIDMNKSWARTWEGMRKNNAISEMEGDFKRLAGAMNFADLKKFSDSFDSLGKARMRIFDVTAAMVEQGRISQERADELHNHFSAFMMDEAAKSKAMKDALDETNRLRKAQDDYNASLSGMARKFHFGKLESDFQRLAAAMDSNDFSSFARGADDINDMRRAIANTAGEMHRLGRMTDQEYGTILERVDSLTHRFRDNEREGSNLFAKLKAGAAGFRTVMSGINRATRGLREHLQGFAGLNVFADMIQSGLDFIHNLDRVAVKAGKTSLKIGAAGSVVGSAFGGALVIASDLGAIIGGLGAIAPAFLIGAGISAGVLQSALKDMKEVLKDLGPGFKKLQDNISKKFWKEAEAPIRGVVKSLMPLLNDKLGGTATAWGKVFTSLADGIKAVPQERIGAMFDRMNSGIEIAAGAMPALVRAFTNLGDAGSKQFRRFGEWIVKLSTDFDKFIQKAFDNGDIDRWIENMIDGFKDIGRSIDGALGIFNGLVSAAKAAGTGGLKQFADKLQAAAKAMQEKGFQDSLILLFSGMNLAVEKIGSAIRDLGPAMQSVMPSIKLALVDIGDSVATIIGYIGDILSNPTVQKGITDFTSGVKKALEILEPAVKPFADSLGNVMSLLGDVVVSVAKIATAFTVELAPVLDNMSLKVQTLLEPLADMATNAIEKLKPVAEALDKFIVQPVVDAMNSDLIPAFNGFVDKAGPVLEKIVKDLGPVITEIFKTILPGAVKIATELLGPLQAVFDLFTPAVALLLQNTADGIDAVAAAMRILKGEARPEDWGVFTQGFSHEKFDKDVDEVHRKLDVLVHPEKASWQEILTGALIGDLPFAMAATTAKIGKVFTDAGDWIGFHVADGFIKVRDKLVTEWNDLWSGKLDRQFADKLIEWFPAQADFINGVTGWMDDVFTGKWFEEARVNIVNMWNDTWKTGGGVDQLDAAVNKWFEESIFKPVRIGWENDMRRINEFFPESFKNDTKDYGLGPAIMNWLVNDVLHMGGATVESINKNVNDWFETNVFKPVRDGWNTAVNSVVDWFKSGGDHSSSNRGDNNGQINFPELWNSFWSDDNIGDINKTVNDWFENNIFKPIREAWDTAWKAVSDWLGSGGGGEESGRSDANGQQFWQSFWGGFGGMMGDVNSWAEGINTTVNNWLETNVWTPIKEWVANLDWAQIGADLWNGFIQGLTGKDVNAWEKIGQGFTGWVEDLKNFFGIQSPSTLMIGIAGDIVAGFLNGFGDFAASVAAKWEEIKTTVATKFEELRAGLATAWEGFKIGWSDFWGGVGTTLGTKWEEFKTTVSTKFEELRSGAASAWEGFQTGWSTFWTDAGTTLSTKWEEFKTTVSGKAGEIKTGIEGWAGDVKNGWNGFWGDVGNTLGQKWGEFTNTTSTKAGEIRTNISNFGSDVSRNWSGFWGTVGGTLSDKWNQFTGTVRDKSGNMKGDVQGMGTSMIGNVQNAMAQMWNSMSGAFMNFVSLVMNRANDIMGYIGGLPSRISSALSGLSWLLVGAGSSIMSGFLSGLRSSWGAVTNFVSGIAGWIAANKGPLDYDAKLLVPAGEAIMGGLQRGLESKMDPLLNTLQTITGLVTDSVTTDLSKSVMYVAGADAAQGLAEGLKANRSSVHNALGSLGTFTLPDAQVSVGGAFSAVGRPTADSAPSRAFTIAEGAVQVHTQAADPWIIAGTVTDALSDAFSTNSRM